MTKTATPHIHVSLCHHAPIACRRLLLEGSASATHYSSKRGSEQRTAQLAPGDTWSEVALLHSSRPMRSSTTVVAGPQVRNCAGLAQIIARGDEGWDVRSACRWSNRGRCCLLLFCGVAWR